MDDKNKGKDTQELKKQGRTKKSPSQVCLLWVKYNLDPSDILKDLKKKRMASFLVAFTALSLSCFSSAWSLCESHLKDACRSQA